MFDQYHGGRFSSAACAKLAWAGRSALVSYADPQQLTVALKYARKVRIDNGAFSFWKGGKATDWDAYYRWLEPLFKHSNVDGAFIPDVIAGDVEENRALIRQWPFGKQLGIPVWHLHEPIHWLQTLGAIYPRVALGSSGQWADPGTASWWRRMTEALNAVCLNGIPMTRLHGLRMLDGELLRHIPMDADSTNVSRNIAYDASWPKGPKSKLARTLVLVDRIEQVQAPERWLGMETQGGLFGLEAIA